MNLPTTPNRSGLRNSSPLNQLYWLTSVEAFVSRHEMLDRVEYALQQGLGFLQYRDKSIVHPDLLKPLLKQLHTLCQTYHAQLIINDDFAIAAEMGCGLHLGKDDMPVAQARQQLSDNTWIGASCYQDIARAQSLQIDCNYVAFGAFYPSNTKPNARLAPVDLLRQAKQNLSCLVVAIGGITPHNCAVLKQAGADILAVSAVLNCAETFAATLEQFAIQLS